MTFEFTTQSCCCCRRHAVRDLFLKTVFDAFLLLYYVLSFYASEVAPHTPCHPVDSFRSCCLTWRRWRQALQLVSKHADARHPLPQLSRSQE
eukprot:5686492-Amphidinium_carterae.1